mgnify:CR=1 FL=1
MNTFTFDKQFTNANTTTSAMIKVANNTVANKAINTSAKTLATNLAKLAAIVLFPTLVACGGGGGGSESADTASPTVATPAPAPQNSPDPVAVTSTAELTVDGDFNLATESGLRLQTDLDTLSAHRGYLSVCTDFEVSDNQVSFVNYDSCLLRTWVEQNGYEQSLAVTHDVNTLVAAVWYPDLEAVDYSVWQRADGMQWSVND